MSIRSGLAAWIVPGLMVLGLCSASRGELQPSQIFLLYNRNVPASGELARYYSAKRDVPMSQSIGLDLPDHDEITPEAYVQKIRDPLRAWLTRQGLQDQIKCIVTFYGVPLRVGKGGALSSERMLVRQINEESEAAVRELEEVANGLAGLVGEKPSTQPTTRPDGRSDLPKIFKRYETLRNQAAQGQKSVREPSEAQAYAVRLKTLIERGDGAVPLLFMLRSPDPAAMAALEQAQAKVDQQRELAKKMLRSCPRSAQREQGHALLRNLYGLRGLVDHLEQDRMELDGAETQASLDSELSLLWWDDYRKYRWVLNPLCVRAAHDPAFAAQMRQELLQQPVVMVARLDGPKVAIVRRMIDDALATEKEGLSGKVYIDARGLAADAAGYGQYDQYLRDLAKLLQDKTSLSVILDNQAALFATGTCPDAALYCGWYSLGKYVDAFTWARGSVAYHIASSEAVSLRAPEAQYWCKRMLEEGVCATLGPVAEPYLTSFPPPQEFFGLLLTGKYNLVECYYMTKPFNSWMQTLLGDPLYTPFRAEPLLSATDVFPATWLSGASSRSSD